MVAYSAGTNGEAAAATVGRVIVGDKGANLVSSQREGGFTVAREGSVVGPSAAKKQPS